MQDRPDPAACCCHDPHGHHHHAHGAGGGASGPPRPELRLGAALVSSRGVSLSRDGRALLEDIDLDISAGEIVTLIGPNGAGKTTLVRLLLGLEPPDAGSITRAAGLTVGYVPQRFALERSIPLTVERFLTLGSPADRSTATAALHEVGAGALVRQQVTRLSGGELQRVLLARALIRNPHLLVLDEPATGVDHLGEAALYTLIGRLRRERGLGVLLVSHDLHVVMAQSDRVVCLNRHICCSGVPHTVARHPEYLRLFGREAALALGVYHHHHDHLHDLGGAPHAGPPAAPAPAAAGTTKGAA